MSVSAENDGFSGKRAFELLQRQCSFGPRVPGSPASAACANFIEHELKEIGLTVKRQNFRVYSQLMKSDVTGTNIIGLYSGDSPSTDLVALSAHWDSRPVADRDADAQLRFQPIIGANDGASGVAVLIEIARVISKRRYPGRIIFLFFDLEDAGLPGSLEQWCLGSTYFAEHSLHDYPITMGVNFDMIGDRNLRIQPEQMMMKHAPELTRDFWRSAQKSAPRYFIDEPLPYVIHDDHEPFLRRGIPYIDLIDFDYPEWHTQEDTPDACSPWSLEIVGKAAIDFVFHRMEKFKK
ncbi:M28 family peptidase [Candidatus Sumerlaeota bacterium]|nr:M28 family peptidase [Candidatus Sumerlaeota bacterium]